MKLRDSKEPRCLTVAESQGLTKISLDPDTRAARDWLLSQQREGISRLQAEIAHLKNALQKESNELKAAVDHCAQKRERIEELEKIVNQPNHRDWTACAYCAVRFEERGTDLISAHVKVCTQHPLRAEIEQLKGELARSDAAARGLSATLKTVQQEKDQWKLHSENVAAALLTERRIEEAVASATLKTVQQEKDQWKLHSENVTNALLTERKAYGGALSTREIKFEQDNASLRSDVEKLQMNLAQAREDARQCSIQRDQYFKAVQDALKTISGLSKTGQIGYNATESAPNKPDRVYNPELPIIQAIVEAACAAEFASKRDYCAARGALSRAIRELHRIRTEHG